MFVLGQIYHRQREIHDVFGGQRQGRISTPSGNDVIFIFTGEAGKAYGYEDKPRLDGTYWYTGEGQVGPMEMTRGNRAIRDHQKDGREVHLFEYVSHGQVRYFGQVAYLGHHFEERPDVSGNMRQVIIFELEIDSSISESVETDVAPEPQITHKKATPRLWSRPIEEIRQIALQRSHKTATPQERRAIVRQRSEAVKVYVRRRAGGTCEGCGDQAPFTDKQGRPFLESHRIRRVSDEGPDDPRWVAALCPNCYREVHYGREGEEINQRLAGTLGGLETALQGH